MARHTETSLRALLIIKEQLGVRSLYLNDWELRRSLNEGTTQGVDIHFHRDGSDELHLLQVEWAEPEDETNTRIRVVAGAPHLVTQTTSRNYSSLRNSLRKALEELLHLVYLEWNKAP